jgi:hypothetical protein
MLICGVENGMPAHETSENSRATDKQFVKDVFCQKSLIERVQPLAEEITWVLLGRQNADQHPPVLPDYCYHIFDLFTRTHFRGFPRQADTVRIVDAAGLPTAKTLDETKQVLQLDWKNLGRLLGIAERCLRFVDLEAEASLKRDLPLGTPDQEAKCFQLIVGKPWMEEHPAEMAGKSFNAVILEKLNQTIAPQAVVALEKGSDFEQLAYHWGPEATASLLAGKAEGYNSFLDVNGQLAGESGRAGIYAILLLLWPEIKEMQAAQPKKTLTYLYEWLQPFMQGGLLPDLDLDTFRDVCAPPPTGIGLTLRPLRSRQSSA